MICLIVFLISVSPVFAQFGFEPEGIPVYVGQNVKHKARSFDILIDGQMVCAWTGQDTTDVRHAWVQIATEDGDLIFDENPPSLSRPDNNAYWGEAYAASDGTFFVKWIERIADDPGRWHTRAQRLTSDGRISWQDGGIHLVDQVYNTPRSPTLKPDSDGGFFFSYREEDLYYACAIGSDGQTREGWPEEGVESDSAGFRAIHPDAWGGFWFVNDEGFNRITCDGESLWEEYRQIEPPDERLEGDYYSESDGEHLIILFYNRNQMAGSGLFGISIYDSAGQRVAADIILDRELPDDQWTEFEWLVTRDQRIILLYSLCSFFGGDCAELVEMPRVVYYSPFEEDPLPWTEYGVELPGDIWPNILVDSFNLGYVNGTSFIQFSNYVYGLDANSDPAWEEQPLTLNHSDHPNLNYYYLVSDGEAAWISFKGDRSGFWKINADGELEFGEDLSPLIPEQRSYPVNLSVNAPGQDCLNLVGIDPLRGIFKQSIDAEGNLSEPVVGGILDNELPDDDRRWEYGNIDGYLWFWQMTGTYDGRLTLFDPDNNLEWSHNLSFRDLGTLYSSKRQVYDDDSNRIVICLKVGSDGYRFCLYNRAGEHIRDSFYSSALEQPTLTMLEYWQDYGWIVAVTRNGQTQIDLLNENFTTVWREPIIFDGQPPVAMQVNDTTSLLAGMRLDDETDLMIAYRYRISAAGSFLSSDSTLLFDQPVDLYEEWSCITGSNGSFFYKGKNRHREFGYLIQMLDGNNRLLLGNEGLRVGIGEGQYSKCEIVPDLYGGSWIVWASLDSIKVLHLNSRGRPWGGVYPMEGFNLFQGHTGNLHDNPSLLLSCALLDPQTDRLWVVAVRRSYFVHNVREREIRVQLVGDEWLSAPDGQFAPLPTRCTLSAYPNPFNSTTTIRYGLPYPSHVSLQVYNTLGQQITTLFEGCKQSGIHTTSLNATDLPTGLYFVRLEVSDQVFTRKIMLIR